MHSLAAGCSILLAAALSSAGQSDQPTPVFSRDGIGAVGRSANVLAPGMVLTLYGGHLASEPVCGQTKTQPALEFCGVRVLIGDRKSTRLNSSHLGISYAVFCLKKKT